MTIDPKSEPSVSGVALSRKLRRRITPEMNAQSRENMKFNPGQQNGMPDGEAFDNTPANRLAGESLHQIPAGFGNAGSLADAVATAPVTPESVTPEGEPAPVLFFETADKIDAVIAEGEAPIKDTEPEALTGFDAAPIVDQQPVYDVITELTHPALQSAENPGGIRGVNDFLDIQKFEAKEAAVVPQEHTEN